MCCCSYSYIMNKIGLNKHDMIYIFLYHFVITYRIAAVCLGNCLINDSRLIQDVHSRADLVLFTQAEYKAQG